MTPAAMPSCNRCSFFFFQLDFLQQVPDHRIGQLPPPIRLIVKNLQRGDLVPIGLQIGLEIADQLLFLGIHRDHRFARILVLRHPPGDVGELGVAVRVMTPFAHLAGGLQTLTELGQEIADRALTHRVPFGA